MAGNPHALGLASRGILGASTIGLTSKGYLVKIFESIYIPPDDEEEIRTTGPARRGFREEEKEEQKTIKITVYAYGTKFETEYLVQKHIKIGIDDVQIVEKGNQLIEIKLRNIDI